MSLINDTPTEKITLQGLPIYVKREDLACPLPGPPFAKVRGLFLRLLKLRSNGVNTVGYMETSLSMATWGVSYFAKHLGMKSVVFYPKYKGRLHGEQDKQFIKWKEFDAEVHAIDNPNYQKINYHIAKKKLLEMYPDAVMLELGLPFEETINEIKDQVMLLPEESLGGSLVICVGSGVMTAGVLKGLSMRLKTSQKMTIYGITVAPKKVKLKKKEIEKKSCVHLGNTFFSSNNIDLDIIDYQYQYEQAEEMPCPFPCNKFYDRKALKWLIDNAKGIKSPYIFWNIGGDYL